MLIKEKLNLDFVEEFSLIWTTDEVTLSYIEKILYDEVITTFQAHERSPILKFFSTLFTMETTSIFLFDNWVDSSLFITKNPDDLLVLINVLDSFNLINLFLEKMEKSDLYNEDLKISWYENRFLFDLDKMFKENKSFLKFEDITKNELIKDIILNHIIPKYGHNITYDEEDNVITGKSGLAINDISERIQDDLKKLILRIVKEPDMVNLTEFEALYINSLKKLQLDIKTFQSEKSEEGLTEIDLINQTVTKFEPKRPVKFKKLIITKPERIELDLSQPQQNKNIIFNARTTEEIMFDLILENVSKAKSFKNVGVQLEGAQMGSREPVRKPLSANEEVIFEDLLVPALEQGSNYTFVFRILNYEEVQAPLDNLTEHPLKFNFNMNLDKTGWVLKIGKFLLGHKDAALKFIPSR